jgi:galactokinase
VALALALSRLAGVQLTPLEVAFLGQGVEHEFAGTSAGIMDPYASVFGRAGHAMLLDCRTNEHDDVPLSVDGYSLLLIDSGVRHSLARGAYVQRVSECGRVTAALAAREAGVRSLRDVTPEMLESWDGSLDPILRRRAWHVVSENSRVRAAVECLRSGRIRELGACLHQSHRSLRDDYEVSCPEIEAIIGVLERHPDVLGARMIGGGFGGMVLALTTGEAKASIVTRLGEALHPRGARPARVFDVWPADGAECRIL